jgi:hypothetical protein
MDSTFASFMANQYGWSEPSLELGRAAYPPVAGQPQTLAEVNVRLPLSLGNRHGLIAEPPVPADAHAASDGEQLRSTACRYFSPT